MIDLFNFNDLLNLSPWMYWSIYCGSIYPLKSHTHNNIYKEMRVCSFNFISTLYSELP